MMRRLAVSVFAFALLLSCTGPTSGEGGGDANEGEGDANEGEGDGANEGEGDIDGEGETSEGEGEGEAAEGEGDGGEGEGEAQLQLVSTAGLDAAEVRYLQTDAACNTGNNCTLADGIRAELVLGELIIDNIGGVALNSAGRDPGCDNATSAALLNVTLTDHAGTVALQRSLSTGVVDVAAGGNAPLVMASCSRIDITDVPPGDYVLRVQVATDFARNEPLVASLVVVAPGLACDGAVCGGVCCPAGVVCEADQCQLPDLSVDESHLYETLRTENQYFSPDSCAMVEGCIDAPGDRRVLRFSTTTPNDGNIDLFMGAPSSRPDLFSFSDCHDHYHFEQYADYRLLSETGEVVALGHKQAFCLIDLEQRDPTVPRRFNCNFQGISRGWADTYNSELDCQWIDVTGVPGGDYTLEVHVNPQHIFSELDYMNNVARVPVHLDPDPNACVPIDEVCYDALDNDCDGAIDEDCAPVVSSSCDGNGFSVDGSALVPGVLGPAVGLPSPSCGEAQGGAFLVNFNVATPGIMYLSTYGSDVDTVMTIHRGVDCAEGSEAVCSDDGCGVTQGHFAGELDQGPYTAIIRAKNANDTGLVWLRIENAGCSGAVAVSTTGSSSSVVDDVGNRDSTRPTCAGDSCANGADEFAYFVTCPGAQAVTVTTCGEGVAEGVANPGSDDTRFDTMLELREGGCLGPVVPDTCDDDVRPGQIRCSLVQTELRSAVGAGDGLWFALVDGCGPPADGSYELHVSME
jgi:hypothetical protein